MLRTAEEGGHTRGFAGTPLRVLLVEDSEDDALLVLRELRRGGYQPNCERVDTPEGMARILAEASARGEPWEIVISDYHMPRFGAPDALDLLRGLGYDMPFIVVSGKIGEDAAVAMMRAGAQDYVAKDNMSRLCPAIERELREAEGRRERQRVKEELREGEERYRAVVEQAGEGILLVDTSTKRILEANAAYHNLLGYTPEEILQLTLYEVVPYPRESMDCYVERVRERRNYDSGERCHLRKDGSLVDVEVSANIISYGGKEAMCVVVRDITERRQAEDELRKNESSLSVAQRIAHLGNWDYDIAGDEAYWSDELYRIVGYAPRAFIPTYKRFLDLVHPDDRRLLRREVRAALYSGRQRGQSSVDYRVVRPDGGVRVVNTQYETVRDASGRPVRLIGTVHDVTERKEAEDRVRFLADLDRSLQPLTDPDEVTAAVVRTLGEHLGADRCAYAEVEDDEDHFRITGDYSRGVPSIVGRFAMSQFGSQALRLSRENEPYVVYDAEEDERVSEEDLAAYRQTRIRAVVSVPLHKGGRFVAGMAVHQKEPRRWSPEEVELVKTVVNRCWMSMERARAARDLRQSEERYRAVIEQSAEGLYLLDAATRRVIETNPSLQRMLGYSAEELRGMELYDLIELPREEVDATLQRTLEQGRRPVGERRYRRKDGSLVDVEIGASVIRYGGGDVVCAVVRDVTERKRAEEALREIREAERKRIARDLHDGVLQDLSYTAMALEVTRVKAEGTGLEEELEQEIEDVRRAVGELREAVYDLRLGAEGDRPFAELVAALVARNRRMAPDRDVSLQVEEGLPSKPFGEASAEALRIVQEALTNARCHSGARNVVVGLKKQGHGLVIEVSDDGRGFGPGDGAGVGLKGMRERAAVLGGQLTVESEPGRGARVRLWAPTRGLPREIPGNGSGIA